MIDPHEIIVDNFAGGGGASLGIEMALGRSPDIAINHDVEAIAMHRANHPKTRHYCESVWKVDPVEACGGRPVGLAWFSPDCTFFSKARGGKPVERKSRCLAWVVIRWARKVKPRVIILENVEEFQQWTVVMPDGQPCPRRKGMTFRRWKTTLENLGYEVKYRELRACDYGAPTIRKRLFVVARCDGLPIEWPDPTHGDPKKIGRSWFDRDLKPWRTAAECIDWSIPCPSIFERERPLAENTLRRIAAGIRRYVIEAKEPFIVNLTHHGADRVEGLDEPFKTVTGANRGEKALRTPFVARIGQTNGNGKYTNDLRDPVTTITTKAEHLIAIPTLVQTGYGEREGQAPRVPGLGKPLGTAVAGGQKHAMVSAFLAGVGGRAGQSPERSVEVPYQTITAKADASLVTSHLVKLRGTCRDGQPVTEPMATISAQGTHIGEVRAFLLQYNGRSVGSDLNEPVHTATTKDRMGLVTIHGDEYVIADIGLRMLSPRELFRAQGFGDSYTIDPIVNGKPLSKTAQVRMCGNSVAPPIAAAVARAQFEIVSDRLAV